MFNWVPFSHLYAYLWIKNIYTKLSKITFNDSSLMLKFINMLFWFFLYKSVTRSAWRGVLRFFFLKGNIHLLAWKIWVCATKEDPWIQDIFLQEFLPTCLAYQECIPWNLTLPSVGMGPAASPPPGKCRLLPAPQAFRGCKSRGGARHSVVSQFPRWWWCC